MTILIGQICLLHKWREEDLAFRKHHSGPVLPSAEAWHGLALSFHCRGHRRIEIRRLEYPRKEKGDESRMV